MVIQKDGLYHSGKEPPAGHRLIKRKAYQDTQSFKDIAYKNTQPFKDIDI